MDKPVILSIESSCDDTSAAVLRGDRLLSFDILQVALTALLAWIWFSTPGGNGETMVIREGTLILMVATGLCMKLTDPLIDRIFNAKV